MVYSTRNQLVPGAKACGAKNIYSKTFKNRPVEYSWRNFRSWIYADVMSWV